MPDSLIRRLHEGADERLARLALTLMTEPGEPTTGQLIDHYGATRTARIALGIEDGDNPGAAATVEAFRSKVVPRVISSTLERALDVAAEHNATMLVPGDAHWPTGLHDLGATQPLALWTRGNTALLAQPVSRRVALVGARAATGYGEHVAMQLANDLAERGTAIVSGGAYGIDGMAHRATLAAGGNTIAVLASGIDRLYPAGHTELLQRVAEAGLLVTELPPGHAPTRMRFLQRGRLIAALSEATVVVEAGYRSGSLAIAEQARAIGRTVAAVPGPVTSAASAGTHRLLRDQNARLITDASDLHSLLPR
jgi:DNA processing protein